MPMKRRLTPTVVTAALILALGAQPVLAAAGNRLPSGPVPAHPAASTADPAAADVVVRGVLEYRNLEGGYYAVGSWALAGDVHWLTNYEGEAVVVRGRPGTEPSVLMVPRLTVIEISLQDPAADPDKPASHIVAPISAPLEGLTIEGVVEYRDLEGGFFSVGGWGLLADDALLRPLVGQRVIVQGQEFQGMSVRMVRQVEVSSLALLLPANRPLPAGVTAGGKTVRFDQEAVMQGETLMVPLRALVEAAGGSIRWHPQERSVSVTLADRTAYFTIGQQEAELNERGVYYFRRNMLAMAKAPVIINGRTLISADAVTRILGLVERVDGDTTMDLLPAK